MTSSAEILPNEDETNKIVKSTIKHPELLLHAAMYGDPKTAAFAQNRLIHNFILFGNPLIPHLNPTNTDNIRAATIIRNTKHRYPGVITYHDRMNAEFIDVLILHARNFYCLMGEIMNTPQQVPETISPYLLYVWAHPSVDSDRDLALPIDAPVMHAIGLFIEAADHTNTLKKNLISDGIKTGLVEDEIFDEIYYTLSAFTQSIDRSITPIYQVPREPQNTKESGKSRRRAARVELPEIPMPITVSAYYGAVNNNKPPWIVAMADHYNAWAKGYLEGQANNKIQYPHGDSNPRFTG